MLFTAIFRPRNSQETIKIVQNSTGIQIESLKIGRNIRFKFYSRLLPEFSLPESPGIHRNSPCPPPTPLPPPPQYRRSRGKKRPGSIRKWQLMHSHNKQYLKNIYLGLENGWRLREGRGGIGRFDCKKRKHKKSLYKKFKVIFSPTMASCVLL